MLAVILGAATALALLFSGISHAGFGSKLCSSSPEFQCYKVKKGDTWDKLFKDSEERDLVMRINRINIRLYPGLIIAIPHSFNARDHSPFPLQADPTGQKYILISMSKLAYGAYDANGELLKWGPISGGKHYCPDTKRRCHSPTGKFAIYSKGSASCVSSKYPVGRGGAPMPYCMFFKGGFALHGSYTVPGYHDSHGCIRLFVNDAEWLSKDFTHGEHRVPVIIRN